MPNRLFSDLNTRLAPSLPGCADAVITAQVKQAAIDVCERTGAWKYEHGAIATEAGTYQYSFSPPSGTEVYGVLSATINGVPLNYTTVDDLIQLHPSYPSSDTEQRTTPRYIFQTTPDTFHVALVPDNDTDVIDMFVSLRPTRASVEMEKSIMDDLEDAIFHRTLQHLMTVPGQAWSNNELAAYHAKQFNFRVSERRARANLTSFRVAPTATSKPWA